MPDHDHTPTPGRSSARAKAKGRVLSPEGGDRSEGVDPPTVRSGPAIGPSSASGGSSDRGAKASLSDVPLLPGPGDRVGDFGLEEAIGAGGMGAVFRAVDIKLDRQVALKILPPDQAVDPEIVQRYYQEGRAAARLDHENIARIYSIGHDGRFHYIAFEYIEGTTIRQRVDAGGPLTVGDAINYTLQIANALVHAAERGVVHRDIKPSNIIVTPHGRAKLVDMGLARRFERGEDTGLTQSGMTLGTFDYISPEQARDPRDVDVRGDLYSLGCTLFHMLSGRPPFPEGTVLQKLLQHQEEPPPDIRKLNHAVPDDLASILVKLMAKDRDRRYQTPELLVRDLLTVAGSLGLRSLNPEGLVWMAPSPSTSWTRHLVWGAPALAFLLVLATVAWWGEGPSTPPSSSSPSPIGDGIASAPSAKDRRLPKPVATAPTVPSVIEPELEPEAPREIAVDSREDLLQIVAEAPPRSTILLSGKGPYDLRGASARTLKGREVTIKAEAGVRPVLRLPRDLGVSEGLSSPTALLELVGGRVTFDGLEFLVEGDDVLAAIRADDADLIVRRCVFRRPGSSAIRSRPSAIEVRSTGRSVSGPSTDRGASLSVSASEFDGGQVGIMTSGAVEVSLLDCTFGMPLGDQATIWAQNQDNGAGPAEFRISHVSVLAGVGPVFRFVGAAPRVRVEDSVFAPPTLDSTAPTLVVSDSPDRLDWRGTDNLYGRFGVYLQAPRGTSSRPPIRTFEAWKDDLLTTRDSVRESGSIPIDGLPWEDRNPLDTLASGASGPTKAFQLALPRQSPPRPGARQSPFGPLPAPILLASAPSTSPNGLDGPTTPSAPTATAERRERPSGEPTRPREVASAVAPSPFKPKNPLLAETDDPTRAMPPAQPNNERPANSATRNDESDVPAPTPAVVGDLTPMPMPVDPERPPVTLSPPAPAPSSKPEPPSATAPSAEPNVIRSVEDFRDALNRLGPGGKTLVVAADADWTLPACRVRGSANWVIRGERGASRPRLRFRPDPQAIPAPDSWSAWMTVQSGSLRLEGVDLVLPELEAAFPPSIRRRAAFTLAAGSAELTLVDCSVTIEGETSHSAVVALLPGEPVGEGRVRVKDCLLRAGGDLVDVAPGRRLDLDVDNAVIATGGTMVHAHGLPQGGKAEELKIVLRQVTARLVGGLAQLQSTPGEPELPLADVNARDTIFATTNPDAPFIRVDGQGNLDDLGGLIRWEGRSVAYHQINMYRRDQSSQPGAVPTLFDRDFWNFKLGRRDESAIHGDMKFLTEWSPDRRPWTLRPEDVRLRTDSPAAGAGSDLVHIPNPPRNS
jgi:eukaryotic-like serine/threonine-protein kinase